MGPGRFEKELTELLNIYRAYISILCTMYACVFVCVQLLKFFKFSD